MKNYPFWELLSYDDPGQRKRWRIICESFEHIDIFYFPEYARLFELHGGGKPYLFVYYQSENDIMIYPFLKREINDNFRNINNILELCDIVSPYGYGGCLKNINTIDTEEYQKNFDNFCTQNKIVSEFIRFHPLLENQKYYSNKQFLENWNETVVMQLSQDNEAIWRELKSSCRRAIQKALKNNIKIIDDYKFENLDIFYEIYTETMHRLEANNFYFFKKEWFFKLVDLLKYNIYLLHGIYNNRIVASGIFIFYKDYCHYFLGGSLKEFQSMRPNNLLLYEAAMRAKAKGCKYFQLGGGYRPNDSLMQFKSTFSPIRKIFYVGKVIHLPEQYNYLCSLTCGKTSGFLDDKYFPLYRQLIKHDNAKIYT